MTAPMLKRSINNQFRKAMKRRRERGLAVEIRSSRKLKAMRDRFNELPETPESLSNWMSRWYRRIL